MPDSPASLPLFAISLALAFGCVATPEQKPAAQQDQTAAWQRSYTLATRAHRSYRKGDLLVAERYYEKALAHARGFPEIDPRLLQTRYSLARLHEQQGRYRLAIRELTDLLPLEKQSHGSASEPVAATLQLLCGVYVESGSFREAKQTCLEILALRREHFADEPQSIAVVRLRLAATQAGLRNYADAESIYVELLAGSAAGRHAGALGVLAENGLGLVYASQGRWAEAESRQLKALSILVRTKALKTPRYPKVLRDLGNLYMQRQRYDDASERYELALSLFEQIIGEDHFEVRDTLLRIADLKARTGSTREAAELRYKAESIRDPRV